VISALNLGALHKQPFFKKGGDTRDNVDPVDGIDSSEEFTAFGNRSLGRFNDANRRGTVRGRLRVGCGGYCD
jgi:hypothetical protein